MSRMVFGEIQYTAEIGKDKFVAEFAYTDIQTLRPTPKFPDLNMPVSHAVDGIPVESVEDAEGWIRSRIRSLSANPEIGVLTKIYWCVWEIATGKIVACTKQEYVGQLHRQSQQYLDSLPSQAWKDPESLLDLDSEN